MFGISIFRLVFRLIFTNNEYVRTFDEITRYKKAA